MYVRSALAAVVALVLTVGPATATVVTADVAIDAAGRVQGGPPGADATVLLGAAAAATPVLAWLTLTCALGSAQAIRRLVRGLATTPAPADPPVRRHARSAAISALVCAAVLAVALPASAAQGLPATVATSHGPAVGSPSGWVAAAAATTVTSRSTEDGPASGWVPRISAIPPSATALVTSDPRGTAAIDPAVDPDRGAGATRVVHRGDSLWSLAAERLGPGATAGEIAAEWPRWWQANRDVIGDDPDVVLPGQILRIP